MKIWKTTVHHSLNLEKKLQRCDSFEVVKGKDINQTKITQFGKKRFTLFYRSKIIKMNQSCEQNSLTTSLEIFCQHCGEKRNVNVKDLSYEIDTLITSEKQSTPAKMPRQEDFRSKTSYEDLKKHRGSLLEADHHLLGQLVKSPANPLIPAIHPSNAANSKGPTFKGD
jgi:hypothetical protein